MTPKTPVCAHRGTDAGRDSTSMESFPAVPGTSPLLSAQVPAISQDFSQTPVVTERHGTTPDRVTVTNPDHHVTPGTTKEPTPTAPNGVLREADLTRSHAGVRRATFGKPSGTHGRPPSPTSPVSHRTEAGLAALSGQLTPGLNPATGDRLEERFTPENVRSHAYLEAPDGYIRNRS